MIAAWMAYAAALSAAVALAALAAEKALLLYRRPVRWVWAASMLLSLALPAAAFLRPAAAPPAAMRIQVPRGANTGAPFVIPRTAKAPKLDLPALDRPLGLGWMAASAGTLLVLGAMQMALLRRRRGWRRGEVDGVPVLVSPNTGPAVIGFVRGRIVLPEWVLASDGETRRLVLAHEQEHVRAGDTRLLMAALAAVAVAPWNPALWWQLRRLRLAMEVDCDARVLRARGGVREYGAVLLELGRRVSHGALGAAAFSEPTSFLERRIRIMTSTTTRARLARAAALASVTALCAVAASATPRPAPLPAAGAHAAADTVPGIPSREQIRALVQQRFPAVATQGMQGNTVVVFEADSAGNVVHAGIGRNVDEAVSPERSGPDGGKGVASMAVQTFAAGEIGPDPVRVAYIVARPGAAVATTNTPVETMVAAVDRYFPTVRTSGTPERIYIVTDVNGQVLAHGVRATPADFPRISPDAVERVEIRKGPGFQVGGHGVELIWIVLKAGQTMQSR
jgi:beta-lactamase regulating signal transducer with metallopeptidase domain